MRIALSAVLLALAAGCGGGVDRVDEPGDGAAGPPTAPAPSLGGDDHPPPAWIETEAGPRWLGFSTFCWGGLCADYVAPQCTGEPAAPAIPAERGEVVRLHLGFEPRGAATLTFFDPPAQVDLPAGPTPTWRVDRHGAFTVFAAAAEGGDASYAGCLVAP